ncbi:hypothetical protein Trydic_g15940 [Trypoxylus dichotomus]
MSLERKRSQKTSEEQYECLPNFIEENGIIVKGNVRRKGREILMQTIGTGGGPHTKKQLNELGERLLAVISKIHLGEESLPDDLKDVEENKLIPEESELNTGNKRT